SGKRKGSCRPGVPPGDLCDSGTILSEGKGCAAHDEDVYGRFRVYSLRPTAWIGRLGNSGRKPDTRSRDRSLTLHRIPWALNGNIKLFSGQYAGGGTGAGKSPEC